MLLLKTVQKITVQKHRKRIIIMKVQFKNHIISLFVIFGKLLLKWCDSMKMGLIYVLFFNLTFLMYGKRSYKFYMLNDRVQDIYWRKERQKSITSTFTGWNQNSRQRNYNCQTIYWYNGTQKQHYEKASFIRKKVPLKLIILISSGVYTHLPGGVSLKSIFSTMFHNLLWFRHQRKCPGLLYIHVIAISKFQFIHFGFDEGEEEYSACCI